MTKIKVAIRNFANEPKNDSTLTSLHTFLKVNCVLLSIRIHVCYRWTDKPPEPLQQPTTSQEEKEVANRIYQPPDLRAREALPLPEVLVARRSGRNRGSAGSQQRAGHHVVPEPAR